ncbi:MAG TPA: CHAT domain-containing protein [Caulobacteraceae bacterium]
MIGAPHAARADPYDDFGVATNAENQACRGVWRFESAKAPTAVDVYCGDWQSPSGTLRVTASSGEALANLAKDCPGAPKLLPDAGEVSLQQVDCSRGDGDTGARKFGLIAQARGHTAYGAIYPSDWASAVGAARVELGVDKPSKVAQAQAGVTPGLQEIEQVYPNGAPGQGAEFNYELLRRRGFEQNIAWSFGASEQDFAELLRAHQKVAPDDQDGEADILSEVGLNLSDSQRFADAGDMFDRAQAEAQAANDGLLITKIANYRALNDLNQGRNTDAFNLAVAANNARDKLYGANGVATADTITKADSRTLEAGTAPGSRREMLAFLDDMTPQEKAAILSAQADDIAAVAARALGRADAGVWLDKALAQLNQSSIQPAWLAGEIYEDRSELALAQGNAAAAGAAANQGLDAVRQLAPDTRIEARLLLAAERARLAQGDLTGGITLGRQAVAILQAQSEAPGLPADEAASHIGALFTAYQQNHDAALAAEYFETLTLVWDGAASRAAAELAARLGDGAGGDSIKAYQDAQTTYRTALARRVRMSAAEAQPADLAAADKAVDDAAKAVAAAESDVRTKSPRYLELLNPAVNAPDLEKVLKPGEGYVRVVLTSTGGFGALVTKDGVAPYQIGLTEAQAEQLVTGVRTSSIIKGRRLPDYDLVGARKLYLALFGPIQGAIANLPMLHIDGGGVLAALPMGALLTSDPTQDQLKAIALDQDYTGVDWMARHHALDTALGPEAFVRTRMEAGPAPAPSVVAFGDFQPNPQLAAQRISTDAGLSDRCRQEVEIALGELKPLPQTGPEAQNAAAAFGAGQGEAILGSDFTDQTFLNRPDVAQASVLVLATHGVLGLSSCFAEPALLTSVGAQGEGLIDASDLLTRTLKARLVVLSACNTAGPAKGGVLTGADLADGGEALSGLARAFIYAGAPNVLATQWPVDATASALQTGVLLRTTAQGGRTVAEALGLAQSELYDNPETAHPFFWSGFILIGDGGAVLTAAPRAQASN